MDSKLHKIVVRLLARTSQGTVVWEDASRLSEGERFRVSFGDAIIEITSGEIVGNDVELGIEYLDFVCVRVLSHKGLVVAEETFKQGEADYPAADKLFLAARSSARRSDAVLDSLLQKLGA